MNQDRIYHWLTKQNIVLEEGFAEALQRLAKTYQQEYHIKYLDDVYRQIGTRKEYIYYWKKHSSSTQTKNF